MNTTEVKTQMMQLWKETFHDSDAYVSLVFDTYFDKGVVEYEAIDGKIVSALLGVPYEFMLGNVYNHREKYDVERNDDIKNNTAVIHGLYLCGLSTRPENRGGGIMSKLIEKAIERALNSGYGFVFLIPADDGLSKFYRDRNFNYISFREVQHYVQGYEFKNINRKYSYANIKNVTLYSNDITTDICRYINDNTNRSNALSIRYSEGDIHAIIKENNISNGYVLLAYSNDNANNNIGKKISGILIAQAVDERNIRVQKLIADDDGIRNGLLQALQCEVDGDISITVEAVNNHAEEKIFRPYRETFSTLYPEGEIAPHDEVYNMARGEKPLAMARILKLAEVLKFAAIKAPAHKYSILVTEDEFDENRGYFEVSEGRMSYTPLSALTQERIDAIIREADRNPDVYHLTLAEAAALLWRHTSDSIVDEVIAIPKLPVNVALLLE